MPVATELTSSIRIIFSIYILRLRQHFFNFVKQTEVLKNVSHDHNDSDIKLKQLAGIASSSMTWIPFLPVLLLAVLLITYLPVLSLLLAR